MMDRMAGRNVLLLFSKVPEPGMVKTRLSVLKDGIFPPEDASDLFGCMLLDVIEMCLAAFERSNEGAEADLDGAPNGYGLVISTAPAGNVEAMRRFVEAEFGPLDELPFPIEVIADRGSSFDEHYNDAFDQVWRMGAKNILSMGADMPALTSDDIVRGFDALHDLERNGREGIVLAPDQEMGVSIVGWNRDTPFDHTGVYYNPTGLTVLPAYVDKAREAGIDAVWLPPVPDVDTMTDLAHNLTLIDALSYCSECAERNGGRPFPWAHRTHAKLEDLGVTMGRIPPNELRDPRDVIDG